MFQFIIIFACFVGWTTQTIYFAARFIFIFVVESQLRLFVKFTSYRHIYTLCFYIVTVLLIYYIL